MRCSFISLVFLLGTPTVWLVKIMAGARILSPREGCAGDEWLSDGCFLHSSTPGPPAWGAALQPVFCFSQVQIENQDLWTPAATNSTASGSSTDVRTSQLTRWMNTQHAQQPQESIRWPEKQDVCGRPLLSQVFVKAFPCFIPRSRKVGLQHSRSEVPLVPCGWLLVWGRFPFDIPLHRLSIDLCSLLFLSYLEKLIQIPYACIGIKGQNLQNIQVF